MATFTGAFTRVGTATRFGLTPSRVDPNGLAWDGDTLFLNLTRADQLHSLDRTTGVATRIGTARFAERSIAWDGTNLYAVFDYLTTVNRRTAEVTRVGSATAYGLRNFDTILGLAWDGANLYTAIFTSDNVWALYTIDRTTGVVTRVGSSDNFGVSITLVHDMTWDGEQLLMVARASGGGGTRGDALFSINRTTGAATRIGNVADFGVSGEFLTGLAWDGSDLYATGTINDALYVATQPPSAPDTPANLALTVVDQDTITASCDAVRGATFYQWKIATSEVGLASATYVRTTEPTNNFDNLSPSTEYFVTVRAGNDVGTSDDASVVSATTAAPPPDTPTNLALAVVDHDTLRGSWDAVSRATFYQVKIATSEAGLASATYRRTTRTTIDFDGLTPETEYFYTVRSGNDDGTSADATAVSATTAAAPPPIPGVPVAFDVVPVDHNTLRLMWRAVSGAEYYQYKVSTTILRLEVDPYVRTTDLTVDVSGLTPGTEYFAIVRSGNAAGVSDDTSPVPRETPDAPPPVPTFIAPTNEEVDEGDEWSFDLRTAFPNARTFAFQAGYVPPVYLELDGHNLVIATAPEVNENTIINILVEGANVTGSAQGTVVLTIADLPFHPTETFSFTGAFERVGNVENYGVPGIIVSDFAWDGTTLFASAWNPQFISRLYTIDRETGEATRVGTLDGYGVNENNVDALGWDGTNLYMISRGSNLYTLSRTTGQATLVGDTGRNDITGMAWDGSTMYVCSLDSLYVMDLSDGSLTLVGPFGEGISFVQSIAWDGIELLGVNEFPRLLLSIDIATGMATRVGDVANFGITEFHPTALEWDGIELLLAGESTGYLSRAIPPVFVAPRSQVVTGGNSWSYDLANSFPGATTFGFQSNYVKPRYLELEGSVLRIANAPHFNSKRSIDIRVQGGNPTSMATGTISLTIARSIGVRAENFNLVHQFKENVSVIRQNARDRTQHKVVFENIEMLIIPQLAQNLRPTADSEVLGTGQLIIEGDFLGHPLVPSDNFKRGDVVIRNPGNDAKRRQLFVWDEHRIEGGDTDVQWLILGLEAR